MTGVWLPEKALNVENVQEERMLEEIEIVKPGDIEARSMAIIDEIMGRTEWREPELSVVRRCIHTSADFDYSKISVFPKAPVKKP